MFEPLAPWLGVAPELVTAAAGVFARIAAALFFIPGFGERPISTRFRLAAALVLTWILAPIIAPIAETVPQDAVGVGTMLLGEIAAGIVIGFAFRILVYILQIAGMIAAQSLSLSQLFGSGVGPDPEPTMATILSMGGVVLAFAAGLHVALVAQLTALYEVLPFGLMPLAADTAAWSVQRVAQGFAIALSLAAPFAVTAFAYNAALGALNRAMPQLMVSFVGVPGIMWLGILILFVTAPAIFDAWGLSMERVFFDPLGSLR